MRTDTPVQIKLADYTPYPFAIEAVKLYFDLDPEQTLVRSVLQVRRLGEGDMLLDGETIELKSIALNGQPLSASAYTLTETGLTLHDVPDEFELEIEAFTHPEKNTALSGLYMSGGRFCTQCESVGFRRITFWPDRPDVMSRFEVRLEADRDAYPILLSNGTPGASGAVEGQPARHFAVWDDPHPKPSYLFALCAGDYDVYRDQFTTMGGRDVDLAIHVDKGDADRAAWAMESLKASMKWDEDVFKREYDLGVFNIVAVRDFNFGAMENKGLNVFNSAYVLADEATATDMDFESIESIVGHEYFHNWTGNRITCRDWFQLCLKEGLTVFRDQEFSADLRSRPVQRIKDVINLRARQFAEDAGPLAHPVRPASYASIDNLYTATVYEKGAELIRMLKTMIGDQAFADGMQIYFDKYDGSATTIEHFYSCFEEASGQDLADFRRWYSQPGTPTVIAEEDWDEATGVLTIQLRQHNPKTPGNDDPKPLPMPIRLAAFKPVGDKLSEETVILKGADTEYRLTDQSVRPLVSINRGFSAPIRLEHKVSDEVKLQLARLDDDAFNTFNTLQGFVQAEILDLAYNGKADPDRDIVAAVGEAVRGNFKDPAFAALLTRVPSVGELFLEQEPAAPLKLAAAKKALQKALALELEQDADAILKAETPATFKPDAEQAGTRALRSAMVTLIAALDTDEADEKIMAQFDTAKNMTESLSALRAQCTLGRAGKAKAITAFEQKWRDNALVMDKWFAVQAATGSAEDVRALIAHPAFELTNPNRVRSVIGVFAMQNLEQFHAPDGSGYALVAEIITQADKLNPALAARLTQAFEQWRKLEPEAKANAQKTLNRLKSGDLSKNTMDIVVRALN
ncbi:MAG: aminopeptidase N [Henriciella sp.]|nr:aminopeptidase N [Henriciella sp.]